MNAALIFAGGTGTRMNIKTMPWLKLSTTNAVIARLKNNEDKLEWIF